MKRILIVLSSIAALLLPMLAFAPTASAATGIVTNGMAWTANASYPGAPSTLDKPFGDYCTLAVVGYDMHGNKVAISAAHCVSQNVNGNWAPDGSPVYEWTPNNGPRKHIGHISYRSWNGVGYPVDPNQVNAGSFGTDYVVIKLNDDADIRSNGPAARIDGIGAANPFGVMCKDGQSTGVTCGWITGQNATRINNLAVGFNGDSGGPAWVDTNPGKIVGYVRAPGEYVKFAAVLNEINSPGSPFPVGKGFYPVNN